MIAQLTGTLVSKTPDSCVIDVGGVGYQVQVSLTTFSTLPDIGEKTSLAIHTHVREDVLALYGFITLQEKTVFQRLIAISGVGPKTALAILSGLPAEPLVKSIEDGDVARLSTIPGVGKKTAERIVIELKDRIGRDLGIPGATAASSTIAGHHDAISALIHLGYPRGIAEGAMRKVAWSEGMSIEAAIRAALKELCRV